MSIIIIIIRKICNPNFNQTINIINSQDNSSFNHSLSKLRYNYNLITRLKTIILINNLRRINIIHNKLKVNKHKEWLQK